MVLYYSAKSILLGCNLIHISWDFGKIFQKNLTHTSVIESGCWVIEGEIGLSGAFGSRLSAVSQRFGFGRLLIADSRLLPRYEDKLTVQNRNWAGFFRQEGVHSVSSQKAD